MHRRTLNLGILAHVDAGKTTLTERLLYAAGVIDEIGSVDRGTTQTDSLALEQQRGITIKSAVVSFPIDDVTVNLIDTPGHPDFIAEVGRVLSVLDGAVLVVSAVEGVQAQTRLLLRALQRLRVPTLLFVNKLDRVGARPQWVLDQISERLTPAVIAMGSARAEGTADAAFSAFRDDEAFASALLELLADRDEALLAAYVDDERGVSHRRLRDELAAQTKRALVHPVFFGSARTGAGVDALMGGIVELLPAPTGDADAPVSASVFKVERGAAGEKIAYARTFSGTIRVRDRLSFGGLDDARSGEGKVTAIAVFDGAAASRSDSVVAGQIAKLWGLADIRIGDMIGAPRPRPSIGAFAPPTLESVIVPRNQSERGALYLALEQLAEQDPLIDLRRDDLRQEMSVSLYGEVQKEVIEATLANDFGLEVEFGETTTIHIERPLGTGDALEVLHAETNPFLATIGLRIDPSPAGTGLVFRLEVDPRTIPLYLYKTIESFAAHMDEYVRQTLRQGLFGWQVTDCVVTMTRCEYSVPDGPPSRRGPLSTAADFRKLTPLVAMAALQDARTVVCEPIHSYRFDGPADALAPTLRVLARLRAEPRGSTVSGSSFALEGEIPAARMHLLQQQVGAATHGEGVLELIFDRYELITGAPPRRLRVGANPLDREAYLMQLARRVAVR